VLDVEPACEEPIGELLGQLVGDPHGVEVVRAGRAHHHDDLAFADLDMRSEGGWRFEVIGELAQMPVDRLLAHSSTIHA
jgi:hypothetical protein